MSVLENRGSQKGQTATEFLFLLPFFALMAGVVGYATYIAWQGLKVQQAANWLARVQGQERVAGGTSPGAIDGDNKNIKNNYRQFIISMFGPSAAQSVTIDTRIRLATDEVIVDRTIQFPRFFGLNFSPMKLEATAFGGEDPYMFALPRWGNGYWMDLMGKVQQPPTAGNNGTGTYQ